MSCFRCADLDHRDRLCMHRKSHYPLHGETAEIAYAWLDDVYPHQRRARSSLCNLSQYSSDVLLAVSYLSIPSQDSDHRQC